MAKYIKLKAAFQSVCEGCNIEFDDQPCDPRDCYIRKKLLAVPTIDAVPVVRCRDCKHYEPNAMGKKSCFNDIWNQEFAVPTAPDDFCSYGERKEGVDNGK